MSEEYAIKLNCVSEIKMIVKPKIISGAWISIDFKQEEYNLDEPFQSKEGKSFKLEQTCIWDKVLIRIKTKHFSDKIKELNIQLIEDDILLNDKIEEIIKAKRVEKDNELTDIFEAEISIKKEYYENGKKDLLEGNQTEYFFKAFTKMKDGDGKEIEITKKIDEKLKINPKNFIITLCPRKHNNLFDLGKDNKPTEKNENKIKELLSEFKKSDIQPFKDNNLFKDYTEIFKEIEFNFYLDFAEKFDFAEKTNNIYYGKKELTIILENKYKNEQDEDEKQNRCKDEIQIKIKKTSGSEELKFLDENKLVDELNITIKPDNKNHTKNAVDSFKIIHPLPLKDNDISKKDKKIKLKVSLVDFPKIEKEIEIKIVRNSDTSLEDLGISEGRTNNLSDPNGFLIREIVEDDNDYSTYSDAVKRVQKLVVYDLDTREMGNNGVQGANYVDGHFRNYLNKNFNYDTVRALENLISNNNSPGSLRGSALVANNQTYRPFENLDIDESLENYLADEYNSNYKISNSNKRYGEIIDRNILIGENNNNSDRLQIDGLLEMLQFNENHRRNATANHIAFNCRENDNIPRIGDNNGFNELSQADSDRGRWIEIIGNQEISHDGLEIEDRSPAWGGHYRRRHEGRDYGRNGNNPHLRSPGYVRIRERVNGIDNDHMIFGIDILGLGFFMRVLHSDNNAAVALNFIFYPDEKIVKFPTKADRGSSGAHFHIEKWQNKKVRNKTIIYDPNNNQPVDVGTTFYFKYYNQIENSQNGVPRYNKDPNISVDEIHIQPNNPYQ